MKKLLVILGPTATGKTDLALSLAKKLNGELISCDSRQVYKSLDIGTGKMPSKKSIVSKNKGYWTIDGVKVWMYDLVDPWVQYTVYDYVKDSTKVIKKILKEGKLPIVVGGTGLYLKGLLEGFPNLDIPLNLDLRGELENLTIEELEKKLKKLSPTNYQNMNESDRFNKRRLLRSIELVVMNPYKRTNKNSNDLNNFDVLKIGLITSRPELNKRIDLRLISRLKLGMIEEAKRLHKSGLSFGRMLEMGLEYRYLVQYLENKISKEQLIEQLQNKIHQYAKRQVTWFKRDAQIEWFDILDKNFRVMVEKRVSDWYNRF